MKRFTLFVSLIVALSVILSACGPAATEVPAAESPAEQPAAEAPAPTEAAPVAYRTNTTVTVVPRCAPLSSFTCQP